MASILLMSGCGGNQISALNYDFPTPIQTEVSVSSFQKDGAWIHPTYSYEIEARVLGVKKYRFEEKASVIPYDLALGWSVMGDMDNVDRVSISQGNRWYFWSVDEFFISREQIEHNSANVHIIPASGDIKSKLNQLTTYDAVRMKGYLVDVDSKNWSLLSSTVRTDVGAGSCEVMYVQELELIE